MTRPVDLISMGRVAADFYAEQIFSPLEAVQTFNLYLGGCPANISVGCARLGLQVRLLSRVGTDDMGRFLRNQLIKERVDTGLLVDDAEHLTALVILGVNPPDRFPLIFYRENCADMQIEPGDVDAAALGESKAFLFTGTCLSTEDMRSTTNHAIRTAKAAGCAVIFDIDYRPVLWRLTEPGDGESRYVSAPAVSAEMQKVLASCDLVVGTEEEVRCAGGEEDLEAAVEAIRRFTRAPIVLKRGADGCEVFDPEESSPIACPAFPVEVLNVLGAGDGFMAGFLRGWLRGEPWETCGKYGNANGALVVSRHGCAPSMASFEELNYFMERYPTDPGVLESAGLRIRHRACNLGKPADAPLQVLAFDHRIQFEEACRVAGQDPAIIKAFKQQVYVGFREIHAGDPRRAILVDPIYGERIAVDAVNQGVAAGMPIEASGAHPIQWIDATRSLYEQLLTRPADLFVKVLWKYHPELPVAERAHQMRMLRELGQVTDRLERRLMLEFIVADGFEYDAASTVATIDEVYQAGVYPFWWKIAALNDIDSWREVTSAIEARDPDARIVVLGQGRGMEAIASAFRVVRSTHHANGFAIGRTIFQPAWEAFLAGDLEASAIPAQLAERYRAILDAWEAAG